MHSPNVLAIVEVVGADHIVRNAREFQQKRVELEPSGSVVAGRLIARTRDDNLRSVEWLIELKVCKRMRREVCVHLRRFGICSISAGCKVFRDSLS